MHARRGSTVPVPSVVRLRIFVHVPYRRRVAVSRRAVMVRDGHRCQYCGGDADSIDHVVPRSRAASTRGTTSWPRAARCNVRKRDRLVIESRACGCAGTRACRRPGLADRGWWTVPGEWTPYLHDPAFGHVGAPAAAG